MVPDAVRGRTLDPARWHVRRIEARTQVLLETLPPEQTKLPCCSDNGGQTYGEI
jgi:hypothetical protein